MTKTILNLVEKKGSRKPASNVKIDKWVNNNKYFTHIQNFIIVPEINRRLNCEPDNISGYFYIRQKKSYNAPQHREHLCKYLNFLMEFYDKEEEIIDIYIKIKTNIDLNDDSFTKENFFDFLYQTMFTGTVIDKVSKLVEDNYEVDNTQIKNMGEHLVFNNDHTRILYNISILMLLCEPILVHYIEVKNILKVSDFLLEFFDRIINIYDVNINRKLIGLVEYFVEKDSNSNRVIWDKQSIRGYTETSYLYTNLHNIILSVFPKFLFDNKACSLITASIKNNIGTSITKSQFEFSFQPTTSPNNSSGVNYDKIAAMMAVVSETDNMYLEVNADYTFKQLQSQYPISPEEIDFFYKRMSENEEVIVGIQQQLVNYTFYSAFGDTTSVVNLNEREYIEMMLMARDKLLADKKPLVALLMSSKVLNSSVRSGLNKKERLLIEKSDIYIDIQNKYDNDEDIIKKILSLIASILSSDFEIISYTDKDLDKKILMEEIIFDNHTMIYQLLDFILKI